ncbi:MAG TPA: PmoA family protein [Bryobacteraceae bacterium]|nr:PmoA family protein [Bryobacteraceae bacterium]
MIRTGFSKTITGLLAGVVLAASIPSAQAQVELRNVDNDHIAITIGGQPFSDFYLGKSYPKPFLAPLRSATGQVVTRKYPIETVEGESRDHPHHRGLWIGYGAVSDVNFWENEADSKASGDNPSMKGLVTLKNLGELKPGKTSGSISAVFNWEVPGRGVMLEEDRTMTFYATDNMRVFDVDFTLTAKTAVKFADTKEGFFAIRLADSMAGKNGGLMTNSEGAQTEKNVWGKRADWVDYDGSVEGQKVGIAIFDGPQSYNHPTRWHARDYALFAANPFGVTEFDSKSSDKGGKNLASGEALQFHYRVVIHAGDLTKKELAKLYDSYAKQSSK